MTLFKVILTFLLLGATSIAARGNVRTYSRADLDRLRDEASAMFHHAYQGYLDHAYPFDELRPLTCDGIDTWGSYSLTLIDALDTLAVMGNYSEFRRVYALVAAKPDFDADINVSVFETNIRIVGGLLSAHLMAKRAGVGVSKAWPCEGPLLSLTVDLANRLLPAFDTATGMPYGTVNLRHGVPLGETTVTCTAGVGTVVLEFGALSRLTGDPIYEETALRALRSIYHKRSAVNLMGNHIDVQTGKWTATDSGIGAAVDSYFEYLAKGSQLLQRPELYEMYKVGKEAIDEFMRHDDWHFWVAMKNGGVTMPVFQSLEAFWPGTLSLEGDLEYALKTLHNYHTIWKQYGFLPEFYNVPQSGAASKREGFPLLPEHIESLMYLYRATKDPWLLAAGEDMLRSIETSAKTECGYATVRDVKDHTLDNRMESFFLGETTKYLYLLFDVDNFIHNPGTKADVHEMRHGTCMLDAGGFVFNTEAHPIDPAALKCCQAHHGEKAEFNVLDFLDKSKLDEFRGDTLEERMEQIEKEREEEEERREIKRIEHERRLEEQRKREREAIERKKELERKRKERLEEELAKEKAEQEEAGIDITNLTDEVANAVKELNLTDEEVISIKRDVAVTYDEEDEDHDDDVEFDDEADPKIEIEGKVMRLSELDNEVKEVEVGDRFIEVDGKKVKLRTLKGQITDEHYALIEAEVIRKAQEEEEKAEDEDSNMPDFDQKEVKGIGSIQELTEEDQLLIKRQSKDETVEPLNKVLNLATSGDVVEHPRSKKAQGIIDALNGVIDKLLPTQPREFDFKEFREKVLGNDEYQVNESWYGDFSRMKCPAAKFEDRFMLQGEFHESV